MNTKAKGFKKLVAMLLFAAMALQTMPAVFAAEAETAGAGGTKCGAYRSQHRHVAKEKEDHIDHRGKYIAGLHRLQLPGSDHRCAVAAV